ncbi:MAG: tRNA pseudouridine(38-40) synthase TruA [Thermodesulfobacteriota bacterium]|nr:tRNA pseudouridine(38-40) synthase TruA [Thermodesulfobacteriota bacterium]
MRNLKLIIEYNGKNYFGWQTQPEKPTIQKTIEKALEKILNHNVLLISAGRTDRGVHALAQTGNITTTNPIEVEKLLKGLNSLLPEDIIVKSIQEVDKDFHSRYHAKSRVYEYHIWNNPIPSVFFHPFCWQIKKKLMFESMEGAIQFILGEHNFTSFRASDCDSVYPVRNILHCSFKINNPHIIFSIEANGFLRHMVRNIIGTLVDIGKGKIQVPEFKLILEAEDRTRAGITAPAKGLILKEVKY